MEKNCITCKYSERPCSCNPRRIQDCEYWQPIEDIIIAQPKKLTRAELLAEKACWAPCHDTEFWEPCDEPAPKLLTRQEAIAKADALEAEAKALRERFEQPELAPGQVWRNYQGVEFLVDHQRNWIVLRNYTNIGACNQTPDCEYLGMFNEVFQRR